MIGTEETKYARACMCYDTPKSSLKHNFINPSHTNFAFTPNYLIVLLTGVINPITSDSQRVTDIVHPESKIIEISLCPPPRKFLLVKKIRPPKLCINGY